MSGFGIGTIIQYCTNDYRFLAKCIEEAKKFSDQIVIPVCDHFFNGQPENRALLNQTYAEHPDCLFVEFCFNRGKHYSPYCTYNSTDEGWIRLWHSLARYIGLLHVKPEIEYALFVDCDEISEGDRLADWIRSGEYKNWNAIRLLGYYYALHANLRATRFQDVALLVRRSVLEPVFFLQTDERSGLYYRYIPPPKKNEVVGWDGKPFFHHYSWVRPRQECERKTDTWGHRGEKDWEGEIRRAFGGDVFKNLFGTTNVEFEQIPSSYFDPLAVSIPQGIASGPFPHVKKVTPRDIFRLELNVY